MSTSFKYSLNYSKPGINTKKKQLRKQNLIYQSNSDQSISSGTVQTTQTGKIKRSTKNRHIRNSSEDNRLKQTAKYMLSCNIDNDIKKLETITFKNQLVRQDLLEIQKRILVININKGAKSIKPTQHFIPTKIINPVYQLVENIHCDSHSELYHDEASYKKYFNKVKAFINRKFPGLVVVENQSRRSFLPPCSAKSASSAKSAHAEFPRLGSFEVTFRGSLVFSKLREKTWPNKDDILNKVQHVLGSHKRERSLTKLEKPPSRIRTRTLIPKPSNSKIPRILSRKFDIQSESLYVSRGNSRCSSRCDVEMQSSLLISPHYASDTDSNFPMTSEDESLPPIDSPDIPPYREITNYFEISVKGKENVHKKITYLNRFGRDGEFRLESSRPDLLSLKCDSVFVSSGNKTRFGVCFKSYWKVGTKKLYLYIDFEEVPIECYQITVNYK